MQAGRNVRCKGSALSPRGFHTGRGTARHTQAETTRVTTFEPFTYRVCADCFIELIKADRGLKGGVCNRVVPREQACARCRVTLICLTQLGGIFVSTSPLEDELHGTAAGVERELYGDDYGADAIEARARELAPWAWGEKT